MPLSNFPLGEILLEAVVHTYVELSFKELFLCSAVRVKLKRGIYCYEQVNWALSTGRFVVYPGW